MLPFLFPAAIVFILDRLTKLRVMKTMAVGESFQVIGNFFRITSVRNTGAAFGMFAGNHRVFVVISLVAIVAVLNWRARCFCIFMARRLAALRSIRVRLRVLFAWSRSPMKKIHKVAVCARGVKLFQPVPQIKATILI